MFALLNGLKVGQMVWLHVWSMCCCVQRQLVCIEARSQAE